MLGNLHYISIEFSDSSNLFINIPIYNEDLNKTNTNSNLIREKLYSKPGVGNQIFPHGNKSEEKLQSNTELLLYFPCFKKKWGTA